MSKKRYIRLAKEGTWILLGKILVVMGSFVGVRLLTELLKPSEYGELALGLTVATLVNQVLLGPLGNGATRFYALAKEQRQLKQYIQAVCRLFLSEMGIVVVLALLASAVLWTCGYYVWIPLIIVSLFFAVLSGGNGILNGIQNAARQRPVVALHQGMSAWLKYIIAAGLLVWLGANSTIALLGYSIAVFLVLCSQLLFFRRTVSSETWTTGALEATEWRKQIWDFSWPFSTWGLFTWAQMSSDRWALGALCGNTEVGKYAALFQLGYYPMMMLTTLSMQLISPILFQRAGDAKDAKRVQNTNRISWNLTYAALFFTALAALIALFTHRFVFRLFVAEEYRSVSYLWPWVLLAGGAFAASQTVTLNIASLLQTQAMTKVKIATALLGIGMNFAGAYWLGIPGVVGATLIFSVTILLSLILILRKIQNARPAIK